MGARKEFSVADGIRIQQQHLEQWKLLLKPDVYANLVLYAERDNGKARDGYDICRGTDLNNYLLNYKH